MTDMIDMTDTTISDSLVAMKHIHLYHGAQHVLRDISLQIQQAEYITIVGPNGAGKTSLLKLIAGMYTPQQGEIYRHNNIRIGYVPQKLHIDPRLPLTVQDFLETVGAYQNKGMSVQHVLDIIHGQSLASKRIGALSGGQLQKVAIAQSLLNKPHCILLDEPAAHLDTQERDRMMKLIQDIYQQQGCTIVLVSHDLRMVSTYAQRVICLDQHICCMGKPADLSHHPMMQQYFGPHLAPYPHHHNGCNHYTD